MERQRVEFVIVFLFSFAILLCRCCPPGYYGTDPQCNLCPYNSYKDFYGYAAACTPCPSNSGHSLIGSSTVKDCSCFIGYQGRPHDGEDCIIRNCAPLWLPDNGAMVGSCSNQYLSSCVIRCIEGYEATGNEERQCIVTANDVMDWTGNPVYCEQILCPIFVVPNANPPTGDCTDPNLVYQTRCSFSCLAGYLLKGSRERQCQLDKTWSGDSTVCEKIYCAPLPSVPYARYVPAECTTQPTGAFSGCTVVCHDGFFLDYQSHIVTEQYICEGDGKWSSPIRQCHDLQPPRLTCPYQIQTDTPSESSTADVLWSIAVSDNSFVEVDSNATVKLSSSYESPHKFPIGVHDVTVEAVDHAENKATCSFHVIVRDTVPPTCSFCPGDIALEVTTLETRVNWQRPICSDNSGIPPYVQSSRQSGDLFSVGEYQVQYLVEDGSGNTNKNCSFTITVTKKTCPSYPAPRNGALACYHVGTDPVCVPMCKKGYDFKTDPPMVYYCSASLWNTFSFFPFQSGIPWPNCTDTGNPSFTRPPPLDTLFYDDDAVDTTVQNTIQNNFITIMTYFAPPFFCTMRPTCTNDNVVVNLGEEG